MIADNNQLVQHAFRSTLANCNSLFVHSLFRFTFPEFYNQIFETDVMERSELSIS